MDKMKSCINIQLQKDLNGSNEITARDQGIKKTMALNTTV